MDRLFSLMIVEDDPVILQALVQSRHWPNHGYVVSGAAASAEEALELAMHCPPDVVLTDICMNGMSGLDLIELMHTHCPETMYVILSGYSEFEYARRALRLGVFEYLTKPIDDEKFDRVFAQLYERLMKNRQYVDSISAACREFVMDVLNREMNPAYLKERFSTLRLGSEARWYRAVLFEGSAIDPKALVEYFDILEWQHIALGTRHALILASDTGDIPERQLRIYIESHPGVRIGIGGRQKLQRLYLSGKEAERALDAMFFTGKRIDTASTAPPFDRIALNRYADALVQAWTGMDERATKAAMGDYFRFVRSQGAGRDIVLLNIVHILGRILSHTSEGQRPEQNMDGVQELLLSAFTVEQLEDYTTSFMLNLQERRRRSSPAAQGSLTGRACAYIDAHIEERITLSDIAAHLYVNASYLSRTFKQAMGDNISHYITHKKIARAMGDMRNLNLGIREIAYRLGFTDYAYFCVQFKKETGETPLNYRKRILYGDGTERKS